MPLALRGPPGAHCAPACPARPCLPRPHRRPASQPRPTPCAAPCPAQFINLNYAVLQKLLKKHDKLLPSHACGKFYKRHVIMQQSWMQVCAWHTHHPMSPPRGLTASPSSPALALTHALVLSPHPFRAATTTSRPCSRASLRSCMPRARAWAQARAQTRAQAVVAHHRGVRVEAGAVRQLGTTMRRAAGRAGWRSAAAPRPRC